MFHFLIVFCVYLFLVVARTYLMSALTVLFPDALFDGVDSTWFRVDLPGVEDLFISLLHSHPSRSYLVDSAVPSNALDKTEIAVSLQDGARRLAITPNPTYL